MIRRIVPPLLFAGLILAVGLSSADEPAEKGEPPLRLKKKKRPPEPPPVEAAKGKDKAKDKAPKAKEEPLEPEDGPGQPEEDEKEILERIGKNMRSVEEKLANKELGEPTRQAQEDILKDLDLLIKQGQQQSGGGGADNPPPAGGQAGEEKQKGSRGQSGSRRSQANRGGSRGGRRTARGSTQRTGRGRSSGRTTAGARQRPEGSGGKPQGKSAKPGSQANANTGGRGGSGPEGMKDRTADLYKNVWGHLPESLRAEMNAYSNPQPFLPRYDDLIKKYYRTIAEQGRRKGD